jgi:prepilin-type processing-associated H-X9-DG protein
VTSPFNAYISAGYVRDSHCSTRRFSSIPNPAGKVLLFENADAASLNSEPVAYGPFTGFSAHLIIATRHHDRSNVVYCDGHAELFDSLSLKDPPNSGNPVFVACFRLDVP